MQVSVEKISNIQRKLTITVPAERVEQVYAEKIAHYSKTAKIKGFRPGKVPLSYITQYYGAEARRDALNGIIESSLMDAITSEQLQPVSTPSVEPKVVEPNQPLEFVASFEVLPEMNQVNFKVDHIEKVVAEIKDEDIDRVILQLRKQFAKWTSIDSSAKEEDKVIIDFHPIIDGVPDSAKGVKKHSLVLGSKTMLPGFEAGLLGVKKGDERNIHLTFPSDYQDPQFAGKPVDFVVTVHDVLQADMPVLTEEFVKTLGIKGSVEDLQKQIRDSLIQDRDRLVSEKLKSSVFQHLLEQNSLEVPNALIEREAKSIHDEMYAHQHDHEHAHSAEETAMFNEVARKRVNLSLIIGQFAKEHGLKPDQDAVMKRITQMASAYENPQEVAKYLASSDRISGIEAQVLEDKVVDKLLENTKQTERFMTYLELKGARS